MAAPPARSVKGRHPAPGRSIQRRAARPVPPAAGGRTLPVHRGACY